jgi:2-polyprenyl-3-methyl-5-hydroxy-6-metoxy-1,4-benzoquinol methylase
VTEYPWIGEKTPKAYWDSSWEAITPPGPVDPRVPGLNNYINRSLHGYLRGCFADIETREAALIEIGCARSAWLPCFHRDFGFRVCGLDYSEIGCRQAQEVLSAAGVDGEIICADLFAPPQRLRGRFDVVVSFGVVEHFENTAAALAACAAFVRPGGRMVTLIPNMHGAVGALQRWADRSVYDTHVPLDAQAFAAAHQHARLTVLSCGYVMPFNLTVISIKDGRSPNVAAALRRLFSWTSKGFWILERIGLPLLRPNRITSPYVVCTAEVPR